MSHVDFKKYQGHPQVKSCFLWAGWGKKMPVGRSGFLFSPPNFNFFKLECTGGKVKKKKKVLGKMGKKSSSRPF